MMKKITGFLTLAVLGVAMLSLASSCVSTPVENQEYKVEDQSVLANLLEAPDDQLANLEPGKVYLCGALAERLRLAKLETSVNEDGLLVARVYGSAQDTPFLKYLFQGEGAFNVYYRFVWFDADGKIVSSGSPTGKLERRLLPDNQLRFSGLAPKESCRNFSFILCSAQ